ncbi:MAG: nucleobase:cation symporter-2 family protein [Clostridia bacterium]|nr:nucleobase:cation symporter-2 family protein [Clostridia bacterium]
MSTPYDLDGRMPLKLAIPLGMQHVLAMFVGNLTPLLVVLGICGIVVGGEHEALRVSLLQNAMLIAGLITLLQLYPLGPVGAKLPIVMGTSSGFIGVCGSVAAGIVANDPNAGLIAYGAVMGACIVGGIFEGALGFAIRPLRRFFPPVVTGTVVMAIGLSLINVGINFFGGGSGAADFGSWQNLLLGLLVLVIILVLKHGTKGFTSISSILLGIVAGYIIATIMGFVLPTTGVNEQGVEYTYSWVVKWSNVASESWFALPKILPVTPVFRWDAILPICIMFIVTAVETIGDISGITEGGLNREATDKELSGGVVCDGVGSAIAAVFGVMPNTSFSQNVGLVAMTKIVNRFAIACGAIFLVLAGLFPKLGAIISIMPQSVLGGAAVIMFASIVVSGIQLITREKLTARTITIVAVALGLGFGLGASSTALNQMPQWLRYVFGGSGIVPAAIVAIVLNIVLPKDKPVENPVESKEEAPAAPPPAAE